MTPDVAEFFSALYAGQPGVLELRTFPPDKQDTPAAQQQKRDASRLRDFVPLDAGHCDTSRVDHFVRGCAVAELGAFFGVATRTANAAKDHKGDIEHCQVLTALFVDADFKHLGEDVTRARIAAFPLPPSAMVMSGAGIHYYWFLETPLFLHSANERAIAKSVLRRLAAQVADVVDEKVSEPARVLRVPGALNYKYDPARLVILEKCDPSLRYTLEQFDAVLTKDTETTDESAGFTMPEKVKRGERHDTLFRLLRSQKARGVSLKASLATCHAENEDFTPPIDRNELDSYLRRCWDEADRPGFSPSELVADGVVMRGGDLSAIVDRAEAALLSTPIYQRGGVLTRAIKLDTAIDERHDIRRKAGSTVLLAVREPWLVEQMGRALRWYQEGPKGTKILRDPQPLYARTLLGRGEWRFPVLRGVVTTPTLASDGRIIEAHGFDAESGMLVDVAVGAFPPVPLEPTKDDAVEALARLADPLRGFPFVNDIARSVALSAMLTALVRMSLRTAPLHGYDAPTAGTGKSLLAEMVGLLATGVQPPAMSQGKSDEEDEKRLSTVLFCGDPVIHIDNCERPISGDFLCSMLTQEVVSARILGLSERRVLPSTALVLASGNNLTFAGDTSRRSVNCRLDAKVERPDTRAFDFDCHAEVLASRPELVVAGLTVLRAYHVAGRPERLTPMGGFDDWAWIRGALTWLGHADPELSRSGILASDPRKDELLAVMDLWKDAFADARLEVGEIARIADGFEAPTKAVALRNKLVEVACRGNWNGKSVGWWLRRNKDRVVGGRSLRCEDGRRLVWWLCEEEQPVLPALSNLLAVSSPSGSCTNFQNPPIDSVWRNSAKREECADVGGDTLGENTPTF